MNLPWIHPELFIVCGSPRSGTTWLHNALIQCGRFSGIIADDMENVRARTSGPFQTDENHRLHRHLEFLQEGRGLFQGVFASTWIRALSWRHGRNNQVMLKSPYYGFFLKQISQIISPERVLYIRRRPDSVALSMIKHPHIRKQVSGSYRQLFDLWDDSRQSSPETMGLDPAFSKEIERNFDSLTSFDRALFKTACFASAFIRNSECIDKSKIRVIDYDSTILDARSMASLASFLMLSPAQASEIQAQFRCPGEPSTLPPHSQDLLNEVRRIENALLTSLPCDMPPKVDFDR